MATQMSNFGLIFEQVSGSAPGHASGQVQLYASSSTSESGKTILMMKDDAGAEIMVGGAFSIEDGDGTELAISGGAQLKMVEGNGGVDINWTDTSHGVDADEYDLTFTLDLNGVDAAAVDVAADSIAIIDANDSNNTKKESIADLVTAMAGSGLGVSSGVLSVDIDELSALGGTGLHQTQDHFIFSDNGTEKKITFSNLQDAVFADVSGDATVAAGGALTIAANAVEGSMLNTYVISAQTELASDGLAAADELMISDGGTLKKIGVDNLMKDAPGLLSAAAIDVSADHIMFLDGGATGDAKIESLADVATGMAGTVTSTGLAASSGVLKLDIQNMTAATSVADGDLVVIDDGAGGTLRKMTRAHFIESAGLDSINIDGGAIDGTPIGANSASTAKFTSLTASLGVLFQDKVRIEGDLEVQGAVNTVTNHETELHIADKHILIASGATAANTDGAGLLLGSSASPHAKLVWDHGNDRWHTPDALHVSGAVLFDGAAVLNGDVDLGNATGDTITATGRFDSDLVPSSDSARDLGTSALQWAEAHVDHGYIDAITATGTSTLTTVDINGGAIDGTAIGAASPSTVVATTVTVNTRLVPDSAGGADLGSTSAEWGDVYIADDKKIYFGSGQDASFEYDEDGTDTLLYAGANMRFSDDVKLEFGAGGDASFEYDEDGNDVLLYAGANMRFGDDIKLEFGAGGDATIEYDENGTDELRFAGAAVTFEQAVSMDANVTLGNAASDVTTVTGKLSGSNGLAISGDAVVIGTTSLSGTVAFAGGYTNNGDYGTSYNKANGNWNMRGSVSADGGLTTSGNGSVAGGLNVGGGYGDTGATISSAGALQLNAGLTVDDAATFGGGYGSTGVTISNAGNIQANGALTVDTTLSVGGGYSDGGSGLSVTAAGALSMNGALTAGSDGEGVDFKVHGGAGNEFMLYDASENLLQFNNSSNSTIVSIGGDATTEYAIDVANGANNQNKVRAAAFVTYSDESLKTDVGSMDDALSTVKSLEGVEFTWKDSGKRDFGFIAQDVEKVLPNAVHTAGDGVQGVDYSRLTSVLVEAVKAQQAQIEKLIKKIED